MLLIGEQAPEKSTYLYQANSGLASIARLHRPTPHEEPEHLSELQQKIRPTTFFSCSASRPFPPNRPHNPPLRALLTLVEDNI